MRSFVIALSASALAVVAACTLLYSGDTDGVTSPGVSAVDSGLDSASVDSAPSSGDSAPDVVGAGCDEPGLVLRLKLDEGTGDSTIDCSSTSAVGHIQSATWTEGVAGKALTFDAGWVSLGNPASLQLLADFTATAWINCSAFPPADPDTGYIVGKTNDVTKSGWRLAVAAGQTINMSLFGPIDGGSSAHVQFAGNVSGLAWTHVAVTFKPGVSRLFVNGVNVATKSDMPYAIVNSTAEVRVGARSDGANPFAGAVDDVRLYNRVLSDQEIAAMAQR